MTEPARTIIATRSGSVKRIVALLHARFAEAPAEQPAGRAVQTA